MKNPVKIEAHTLPLIREVGFMYDIDGVFKHPDRVMEYLHVFIYVKKGRIHVIEDDIEYYVDKGSYLFLRKDIYHFGRELYLPGSEWYYIHFSDKNTGAPNVEFTPFRQTSLIGEEAYQAIFTLPKYGKVTNAPWMETKLVKLLELYESTNPIRPILSSMEAHQIFLELYMDKMQENANKKSHRIIARMVKLLHENEDQKLTGDQIANAMGMNYSYLSSLFKNHTGKSVTQYQNEILIEKAIQLLKKDNQNVSEVSDYLGFSNPFYFSRVFKKVTGVSPSTYLQQIYRN